ncbi:MAG: hypothetical protein WD851_22975 [Pirellulales bacterium]
MVILGHISNGVVVLEGDAPLPEGAAVAVVYPRQSAKPQGTEPPRIECEPGRFPLVRGGAPGSLELTNERIQEILDAEDIEAVKRQWNVSS